MEVIPARRDRDRNIGGDGDVANAHDFWWSERSTQNAVDDSILPANDRRSAEARLILDRENQLVDRYALEYLMTCERDDIAGAPGFEEGSHRCEWIAKHDDLAAHRNLSCCRRDARQRGGYE